MRKRMIGFLCMILLSLSLAVPAFAANSAKLVTDEADLLTDSEETALQSKLDEIGQKYGMDIVVVTKPSLYGYDIQEIADDFYDEGGYAADGILLLVAMDESEWYISTTGFGIDAVTDAGLNYMSKQFVGSLSDGEFYEAFSIYADQCDDFIRQAKSGEPYDTGNLPKGSFKFLRNLLVSLVIGLVSALIATGIMKGKLKTVQRQLKADSYVKSGSMKVTNSKDVLLYTNVSRQARPKETRSGGSRTHISSSGRVHGGGGGKF